MWASQKVAAGILPGVWKWSLGKGWEPGNLSIGLDDSQPTTQNHSHPREALQSPGSVLECYGLNLKFPLEAPDLNTWSLACGAILKAVGP